MGLKKKPNTNKKEDIKEVATGSEQISNTEKEAIKTQEVKHEEEGADTERLRRATAMVSNKFNLGPDYQVVSFKDDGKKMSIKMSNEDFCVSIDIKNTERHGLEVFKTE